jgi:UDP-N-acetylglucosamine 1-carboxyvinyltransferase
MDMFVIRGGKPLQGTVTVSGSKNAALPLMAASILASGPVHLRRVPNLADVTTLSHVLGSLGVRVARGPEGGLSLQVVDERSCEAPYDLVRKMRASICVLGPLVARRGRARVSLPGGCNIGHRPIDIHLRGLQALGADIRVEQGYVVATARRLKGAVIDLAGPCGSTVTGTCNIMAAAALAEGRSILRNVAREPEVVDLGELLIQLGARVSGLGTSTIEIEGVRELGSATHTVIPDRIEAGTLMIAAAATGGHVRIERVSTVHLAAVITTLRSAGAQVESSADAAGVDVIEVAARRPLHAVDCTALPYPAFPTDLQAQMTSLLTSVAGDSTIADHVFPNRFMHVSELCRMGAEIHCKASTAMIRGGARLQGANVMASDLRASAGLVIAGLMAEGETTIRRIYHLDRGYERLEERLSHLGADVRRLRDGAPAVTSITPALRPFEVDGEDAARAA